MQFCALRPTRFFSLRVELFVVPLPTGFLHQHSISYIELAATAERIVSNRARDCMRAHQVQRGLTLVTLRKWLEHRHGSYPVEGNRRSDDDREYRQQSFGVVCRASNAAARVDEAGDYACECDAVRRCINPTQPPVARNDALVCFQLVDFLNYSRGSRFPHFIALFMLITANTQECRRILFERPGVEREF